MKRLMIGGLVMAAFAAMALTPAEVREAMEKNYGKPESFEEKSAGAELACQYYYYPALDGKPRSISILVARPGEKLKLKVVRPEILTEVSVQADASGALAAVNGTYFGIDKESKKTFDSGLLKVDGALHPDSRGERADRSPTSGYFWSNGGNDFGIDYPSPGLAAEKKEMIWGHPMLLKGGKVDEKIPNTSHMTVLHPRTAVGKTADRTLLVVVVDGRHAEKAAGMSCFELADFMKKLGCVDALNLDGGGSSTMVWRGGQKGKGEVINYPCDNKAFNHQGERKVSATLQFFKE